MDNEKENLKPIEVEHQFLVRGGQPATLVDGIVVQSVGEMIVMQLFQSEPQGQVGVEPDADIAEKSSVNSFCQGKFALTKESLLLVSKALEVHTKKIKAERQENLEEVKDAP